MPEPRSIKRFMIISVYVSIPLLMGTFYYVTTKEKANCTDDIQNQNESGVDCGGVCAPCFSITQDLVVKKTEVVYGGTGIYDGLVEISNPNGNAGSPEFSFKATLKDTSGNVIGEKSGTSFILPAETKHIPLIGFSVSEAQSPSQLDFEIIKTEWQPFNGYQKPPLSISNKRFNEVAQGWEAYGILKNDSVYDFETIKIVVMLRDMQGNLVALNVKQINTVRSGEERDFPFIWPYKFRGEPASVEVEAETNTFDKDNFLDIRI